MYLGFGNDHLIHPVPFRDSHFQVKGQRSPNLVKSCIFTILYWGPSGKKTFSPMRQWLAGGEGFLKMCLLKTFFPLFAVINILVKSIFSYLVRRGVEGQKVMRRYFVGENVFFPLSTHQASLISFTVA